MIFLFQGARILRFQPLIFRGIVIWFGLVAYPWQIVGKPTPKPSVLAPRSYDGTVPRIRGLRNARVFFRSVRVCHNFAAVAFQVLNVKNALRTNGPLRGLDLMGFIMGSPMDSKFEGKTKQDLQSLGGGNSNIFGIFTPIPGEMIQFDEHIFQMC